MVIVPWRTHFDVFILHVEDAPWWERIPGYDFGFLPSCLLSSLYVTEVDNGDRIVALAWNFGPSDHRDRFLSQTRLRRVSKRKPSEQWRRTYNSTGCRCSTSFAGLRSWGRSPRCA